tara:strand:+ start:392 stop:661 length:270 start_codon:yes stop_codon:yes gene_type:complete
VKALNGNVILEPIESCDMTEGGLFKPADAKEKTYKGKILYITKYECTKQNVCIGQIVFYDKYDAKEIKIDDKTRYIVVHETKLLATEGD